KCLDKFAEFRRRNKTILLVTHSLSLVERFCDHALWLESGHFRADGDPRRVVDADLTAVEKGEEGLLATTTPKAVAAADGPGQEEQRATEPTSAQSGESPLQDMFKAVEGRWGSREIEITEVTLLDQSGQPSFVFHTGDQMAVKLKVSAAAPADDFVFGVSLFNAD